jgi:hypothetical protein
MNTQEIDMPIEETKPLNTRQKILQLYKEGKTPTEIIELLKDEKVSNIKSYVSRVRMDLDKIGVKAANDEKISTIENQGIRVRHKEVSIPCQVCKQMIMVNANDPRIYKYSIVQENFVCISCESKLKKGDYLLDTTLCTCGGCFTTHVFKQNVGKYSTFECANCKDKETRKKESKDKAPEIKTEEVSQEVIDDRLHYQEQTGKDTTETHSN